MGYLILRSESPVRYRGVDRQPFVPRLNDQDPEFQRPSARDVRQLPIWAFYSPGWRRDAYRLYDDHLLSRNSDLALLSSESAAREIVHLIEPHVGQHEIVFCEVFQLADLPGEIMVPVGSEFLGHDIARPGGDFTSAILNGLLVNPDPVLVERYAAALNQHGLFADREPVTSYATAFRQQVPSEASAELVAFRLSRRRAPSAELPGEGYAGGTPPI
jgi:hypothetical protein